VLWLLLALQQTYLAEATGSTRVRLTCRGCQARYSYRLTRTAVARGTGYGAVSDVRKDLADERAEQLLADRLAQEFDCVPCPRCGDYQPTMVARLKGDEHRELLKYQSSLLLVAVLCAVPCVLVAAALIMAPGGDSDGAVLLGVGAAVAGCCAVVGLWMWVWNRRTYAARTAAFDPNDPSELSTRLALARRRAQLAGPPVTGAVKPPPLPDRTGGK
jgi:hypothetical protein